MLTIPDPGFAGDDGTSSPDVLAAMAAAEQDVSQYPQALRALADSRVLVPVVAVLGEVEYDENGLAHDKSSDMATVLLTGADGRTALLAFTGSETLTTWNPQARPVPVPLQVAAQSALQDHADALVINLAGPTTFVLEGDDLVGVAAGWELASVGEAWGWIRPTEGV